MFIAYHLLTADAAEQEALQLEAAGDIEAALCLACKALIEHTYISLSVDHQTKRAIEAVWDGESAVYEPAIRRGIYDSAVRALCADISKKLGTNELHDFSPHDRIIDELKERL